MRRVMMKILLATDAFPPICGGSGWSTYELAKGLRDRGHDVMIVRPVIGPGVPPAREASTARRDAKEKEYDGFRPVEFSAWAPRVPFVRNYFKNERLYRLFETFLRDFIRRHRVDVVHAQHLLTGPPSVAAARQLKACRSSARFATTGPSATGPTSSTTATSNTLCPGCSAAMMTRCVRPRAGALWPLAAADHSVHAREPRAEASESVVGERGRRRQHDDRARPA